MAFDPAAPPKLKKCQKWFASIITRAIDEDSRMNPISPAGELMEEEAWDYIKPSPTLRPAQRIEIYNQQYWWRLMSILHDTFPLVTRLFGYHDFNQTIAIPYLLKYPPNTWSLNDLGEQLPKWIEDVYDRSDKSLILDSAKVDWAYNRSFLAKEYPSLNKEQLPKDGEIASILEAKIYLQPSIWLFALDYDLFNFRVKFLEHTPEHWVENDFPHLEKSSKWIILSRNIHRQLFWEELSEGEFHLLKYFQNGASLSEACQWLEEDNGTLFQAASENLHTWLQSWVLKHWLTLDHQIKKP